ncbi:MAG: family 10 glycosylhydrolase [Oscillospiraceae bacterium]|nr:family 10 glycosylhydrolase [Oscillospiraceae bacterium]
MNNKKSFVVTLTALLLVTVLFATSLFVFASKLGEHSSAADVATGENSGENPDKVYTGIEEDTEMRGIWIATVSNINFPSRPGLSADQLKAELDDIVATAKAAGMNNIYFQAHPCSDSMFDSKLFPVSSFLSENGSLPDGFDPLKYIIEIAHKNNIKLSAWINPYRVTYSEAASKQAAFDTLPDGHIAKKNPDWIVEYNGRLYFNPALPEVRAYVIAGIEEIVNNYDVDGIHIDDYFYPYPVTNSGETLEFDDAAAYAKYAENNVSLGDFRRGCVNTLVKGIYDAIKAAKPAVRFGISPFGIWANSSHNPMGSDTNGLESYYDIYCDPLAWIKGGYIDYICPQIYWNFQNSAAAFDILVKWWSAQVDGTDVDLYFGHAAYRVSEFPAGADEIMQQITFARSWMGYKGSVFYGYKQIKDNQCGIFDALSEMYAQPCSAPDAHSDGKGVSLNKPNNNSSTTYSALYALGTSDPAYPVYYKGIKIPRTKNGYFSLYFPLNIGTNTFVLTQNSTDYTTVVNRKAVSTDTSYAQMSNFVINSIFPSSEAMLMPGDKLTILCTAPAGSKVMAYIGEYSVELSPTINPPMNSTYMAENYCGIWTVPSFENGSAPVTVSALRIDAVFKDETKTAYGGVIKVIPPGCTPVIEVKNSYSYLKISPTSSFYDDYLNAEKGMRDYVVGLDRGYYKLKFGGYISKDDVTFKENGTLLTNRVITAASQKKTDVMELRFGVTENVPVNAVCKNGIFTLTMYNTSADYAPDLTFENNPIFKSASVTTSAKASTVTYTIYLKASDNYYGFSMMYKSSTLVLSFKLPQTIPEGEKPLAGKVIIVDAGHGGTDNGADGFIGEIDEAYMNLLVAMKLKDRLVSLGAEVIMTRESDVYYDLNYRMKLLNDVCPDLSISVHHNSISYDENPNRVRGFVGLYCNEDGRLLAKCLSEKMTDELDILQRSTAYQMLAMCRNYKFPQTLLECGFMCSAYEYEQMQRPDYADRCAEAAAQGVLGFYKAQAAYLNGQ